MKKNIQEQNNKNEGTQNQAQPNCPKKWCNNDNGKSSIKTAM
jgi:hypothetical protein